VSSDPVNPAVEAISVFFPCYNDEATIGQMVEVAVATLARVGVRDAEVIVVNDGSTDGSADVLAKLVAREPLLRVVTHERNRGYGGALLSGFGASTRQWIFYTDGDGQFDAAELELLVQRASDDVDVVQGWKIRRADGPLRAVIGRVYHRFVSFFFGLKIRDTDCDFRLIRHAALEQVQLEHTTGVICVELVRKLQDADARFTEVGVHHYRRVHGKSEFFRLGAILRTLRDLAVLWVRMVVLRQGRRSGRGQPVASSTSEVPTRRS
jgi:glycosyltransferase involved in cell wall biosynthesis